MRILVLGAGVVGVTAAWYLAQDGHDVTVLDRHPGAALETSFANGGQISASYAEPWANPEAPLKILQWLGRDDAPLLFRLRADPRQWRWGLSFLYECLPSRTRHNTIQCLNLALYSRDCLKELRAQTGIEYDHLERGILSFYTDSKEFAQGVASAELMRQFGCDRDVKTVAECVAIEPALAACRDRLAGGIFTVSDESGDAQRFTQELARMAEARGVKFRWGMAIESLAAEGDALAGVRCINEHHRKEVLDADAYVMALGSYSPFLLKPLRVPCLIYPAKGYSATIAIDDHRGAPTVSLTDLAWKIVFTRLGDRLRVAGTAELSGYDKDLNLVRCEALVRRTFELFPDAGERDSAQFWTGLRPATPSNVPLVGGTRYRNLFLDTGHGTLGWTMACGSGRALADVIAGRKPDVDFAFTGDYCRDGRPLKLFSAENLARFTRPQAALIHLGLSALVAATIVAVMVLVWYPSPYFAAAGGGTLLMLLIGVDVVLGPLLTFVVYDPAKKSLVYDLAAIAMLQIAALIYGVHVMAAARPAFIVYLRGGFDVVSANDAGDRGHGGGEAPGIPVGAVQRTAPRRGAHSRRSGAAVEDQHGSHGGRPRPDRLSAVLHSVCDGVARSGGERKAAGHAGAGEPGQCRDGRRSSSVRPASPWTTWSTCRCTLAPPRCRSFSTGRRATSSAS